MVVTAFMGLLGAAAKETFVPFASMFALTWWFIEYRRNKAPAAAFIWLIALAIVGLGAVLGIRPRWSDSFAGRGKSPNK